MSGRTAFSPHRNFADNLRALCARHGSIAAVCAAIGMNRQQFNKYLAGSTLPNAPTLEKICGFFEVAPESLFHVPQGNRPDSPGLPRAASLALGKMRQSTLRPGCYHFYTPWPREPSKCMRAALFVYQKDGLTLFSRFTKFRSPGHRQRYSLSGRHDGIVLESDNAKYLLATSHKGQGDMSLVSIGVESSLSQDFIKGLALVMDPAGHPSRCGQHWNIAGLPPSCGGRLPRRASCRCRTREFPKRCGRRFQRRRTARHPIWRPSACWTACPCSRAGAGPADQPAVLSVSNLPSASMAATILRVRTAIGFDALRRRIDPGSWARKALNST